MRTITKQNIFVLGIAVLISALIFIFGRKKEQDHSLIVTYNVFHQQTGWGYEIIVNNKTFIHQDFVPALPAQKGFKKKEYAEKAALLVINKIRKNNLPALTVKDLAGICPIDSLIYERPANQ